MGGTHAERRWAAGHSTPMEPDGVELGSRLSDAYGSQKNRRSENPKTLRGKQELEV